VARNVLARFPGEWQVRQVSTNAAATSFWRRAIPVPFEEDFDATSVFQHFEIPVKVQRAESTEPGPTS